MPSTKDLLVEKIPNNSKELYLVSYQNYENKSSMIYLVEAPPNIDNDISMTFMGMTVPLSYPPIVLSKRRVFLISKMENSEIIQILENPIKNEKDKPYFKNIFKFENLGMVQQIFPDSQKNLC